MSEEQTDQDQSQDQGQDQGSQGQQQDQSQDQHSEFNAALPDNWTDSLDEGLRGIDGLNEISSLNDLVGKYKTATEFGMGNEDMIKMPVSDEEFEGVYDKLGRPEKADGYEFGEPEGMKELNLQRDETGSKEWKAKMHELGLSQKQAKGLSDFYNGKVVNETKALIEARKTFNETGMSELRNDITNRGLNFDNVMKEVDRIATETQVSTELEKDFPGISQNPLMKNILVSLVEGSLEDGTPPTSSAGANTNPYAKQIGELVGDRTNAYWDSTHPNHDTAVKRVHELRQKEAMYK